MSDLLKHFYSKERFIYASLIVVPLLVYFKSLFYNFSPLDEQWLIVNDTGFLDKWDNLIYAFKDSIQKIYYRPLLIWSFIIDYHVSGLDPFFYHFTNLVYHLLAVILLYRFMLLLNVEKKASHLLSLLFSVHPLLTHAVSWIPGRNDVLLCIFGLCSLIHLIQFIKTQKAGHALLHVFSYACAFFTKETGIFLPVIFLAVFLIYKPFNSSLMFLSGAWLVAFALWFYLRNNVIQPLPYAPKEFGGRIVDFMNAIIVFLGKSIFPFFQSVTPTPKNSYFLLNLALVLFLSVFAFIRGIKNKKIATLGLLIFITILALSAWFGTSTTLGEQNEHRAYLPLAGILLFISQVNFNWNSKLVLNGFLIFIAVCAGKTFLRENVYKDEISYLEEGIADCPDNYLFHGQMGNFLYLKKDFKAALPYLNTAIERQPDKAQLLNSRGNIYFELNKKDEAIADYTRALKNSNNNVSVYMARCMTFKKFGDMDNARADMEAIKKLYPGSINPQLEKEIMNGWFYKRLSSLNALIQQEPGKGILYVNRAKLYFDRRMGKEALADLKKAVELEPGNKEYKGYYDKLNATFPH